MFKLVTFLGLLTVSLTASAKSMEAAQARLEEPVQAAVLTQNNLIRGDGPHQKMSVWCFAAKTKRPVKSTEFADIVFRPATLLVAAVESKTPKAEDVVFDGLIYSSRQYGTESYRIVRSGTLILTHNGVERFAFVSPSDFADEPEMKKNLQALFNIGIMQGYSLKSDGNPDQQCVLTSETGLSYLKFE
jgi:hypothetical protein